jgi:pimeloyl-ACP methyl ester carboxylesterase
VTSDGLRVRWHAAQAPGRGIQLHVRRVVEPSAPPVLLLHGLGVSGSVLQSFARRLLPELAALVPDLRGHGQSDAPPDGYLPADYATDLVELIDSEIAAPVPIIGHSLGALVGMQLAASRPELVDWLVLLDPPLDRPPRDDEPRDDEVDPAPRDDEVESVYRLRHAPPGELEAYLLERDPGGGELLASALAAEFRHASDRAFEAMLAARPFAALPVRSRTLLVQADPTRGGVLGDRAAAAAIGVLGNATLVKIEGAPHAVHATHAAEVITAIRRFAGYMV